MILRIRHKGLQRLFEDGDRRAVDAQDADKLSRILVLLNRASLPRHMDLPGFRLHRLKGDLRNHWAVTVRANWRVVFRFEDGDVTDVDLIDYH